MFPMTGFRKALLSLAIFGLVAFSSAAIARADQVTFDLSNANAGISGFPPPYANVLVNRTSATTATITFTAYPGYLIGGAGAVGLNFNGAITLGAISFTGGAGDTSFSSGGAGNEDGFGSFNFRLDGFDGFTRAVTSVTFDVTLNAGSWATAASVLTGNASGNTAAAHIFVVGSDCGGSPCTGFASEVPEPTSMLLLGTGLVGVAAGLRKRLRN
jgi:PEP-CTERM motif